MNILYVRVSSLDQNTARQTVNEKDYKVFTDYCSGSIAFADRKEANKLLKLLKSNKITSLTVSSIDRLGRNVQDLLNTIEAFNEMKVPIIFKSQGLTTLDHDGKENPIARMIISILGVVSEMERVQIKERQREGIDIAKIKGKYKGRKIGSTEDNLMFLSKPKNKLALEYLKRGDLKNTEISKLVDIHINTITKIRKLGIAAV
ncbi:putative transposon Tn552 DNA-invertase bin3 [compost metagenome]